MSVINQVLVELEKRRASGTERGVLPDHVRALPDGVRDYRGWWLAVAAAAAAALLVMAWLAVDVAAFMRPWTRVAQPAPEAAAMIEKVVSASAAGTTDVRPQDGGNTPDNARLAARLSF